MWYNVWLQLMCRLRCGNIGGLSLRVHFEALKVQARPSLMHSLILPAAFVSEVSSQLRLQHQAYLFAAMLSTMLAMDSPSGTVSKP